MNELIPIEYQRERILTTEQLAQIYETGTTNIKSNFNASKEKFIEGKHFFLLTGEDLRDFKNSVRNSDLVGKNASQLYLWTKRGASRHCKMLGTDKAWEQFDILALRFTQQKNNRGGKQCGGFADHSIQRSSSNRQSSGCSNDREGTCSFDERY